MRNATYPIILGLLLLQQTLTVCGAHNRALARSIQAKKAAKEAEQDSSEDLGVPKDYTVPLYNRLRGVRYLGDGARLRLFLERMQQGRALHMGVPLSFGCQGSFIGALGRTKPSAASSAA